MILQSNWNAQCLTKQTFSLMPNLVTIILAIFVALSKSLEAPMCK